MKTKVRASSLPTAGDCARRWAAQAMRDELIDAGYDLQELPKSVGASVGTGTHSGVAYLLQEKMQSGALGAQDEAEQRAFEDFTASLHEEGVLWDDTTPNISDAQRQMQRMIRVYRETIGQHVTPVAIERRLEADIGEDFILSGQSDVQALEPDRIRDTKTGRFAKTHYAQVGSYSLLSRTAHPESTARELCTDFIPRAPLRFEQPLPVTEFYDQGVAEQSAMRALQQIKSDVFEFRKRVAGEAQFAPEHAFLANPSSMLCSPKWCPAFGTNFCREHKKGG